MKVQTNLKAGADVNPGRRTSLVRLDPDMGHDVPGSTRASSVGASINTVSASAV